MDMIVETQIPVDGELVTIVDVLKKETGTRTSIKKRTVKIPQGLDKKKLKEIGVNLKQSKIIEEKHGRAKST